MTAISAFLSIDELARQTKLPAAWLKRAGSTGEIPSIRVGRRMYFDATAVATALSARQSRSKVVVREVATHA